jgi:AAA family ATP:ADP antiporter
MKKITLHRLLSRVIEIKPGEQTPSLLLFSYFFLITTPYTILKSLRNASYLTDLGPQWLPLAYFMTALLTGFVVNAHSKLQVKISRRVLITVSLLFFLFTGMLFIAFSAAEWPWLSLLFWLWTNILIVVLTTQFWITVNDIFNLREAKRLVGFFGSGGILGGIVGGAMAALIIQKTILLGISILMLLGCVLLIRLVFIKTSMDRKPDLKEGTGRGGEQDKGPKVGFQDCFAIVKGDRYLRLIASIVTVTLVVSTMIDFQFNSIVKSRIPETPQAGLVEAPREIAGLDVPSAVSTAVKEQEMNSLTAFFGYFNSGMMIFAFFLQLLMTSNLIKRYGIKFSLLIYPLILLLCSAGIIIFVSIFFAIIIKGSDKSLSFSINQSVRELLYIPVSAAKKYKAKIFIDMFLNRAAKGLGALILLVPILLHLSLAHVSLISIVFILLWVFLNIRVSLEYRNTVKKKLTRGWERGDQVVEKAVDVQYMKLIFNTLESRERSPILYAMHVYDLLKQDKLTPEVRQLIGLEIDEENIGSLGALFDTGDPQLMGLGIGKETEESLDEEIKEIMAMDVYKEVMGDYVEKVMEKKSETAEISRMEIAKAIGMMKKNSPLVKKLDALLHDQSPEVLAFAMDSAATHRQREYVPIIIKHLSNPLTQEDAEIALAKFGPKIAGTLSDYLEDNDEDIDVRKGVTNVLARLGNQQSVDLLLSALTREKGDLKDTIIDALDRIRSDNKDIIFKTGLIRGKILDEVERYCRLYIRQQEPSVSREKGWESAELQLDILLRDIFRLLGLIYPFADITKAYQNIGSTTKDSTSYAVELLENILKKEDRDILLPLIEELTPRERVKRMENVLRLIDMNPFRLRK